MTARASTRRALEVSRRAARLPDQPRRAVPEGLDRRRGAARPPDRLTTPLVRDRDRRARAGRPGTRRSTCVAGRLARAAGDARRRRGRGLRRRRADQREGLPARQVRPGRAAAPAHIDYNGRFCMSSAAAAGNRAFGIDRGLPFPLADLERGRRASCCVGSNVAETMPPFVQHLDRRARRAAGSSSSTRGARATAALTADGAGCTSSRCRAPTSPLLLGLLHLRRRGGLRSTSSTSPRGPTGWDDVRRSVAAWWPERVERRRPACPRRPARGGARPGRRCSPRGGAGRDRPHRSRRRAARRRHRHGDRLRSTSRSRSGCPGDRRAGYGCLTGQGNGQGGREHGQKADQLPGYRSIDDPAARAHVAAVWGVDPRRLPGKGRSAVELLGELGTATVRGRCWSTAATSWSSRPTPPPCAERLADARPARRLRLRAERDRRARRRRPAGHPVGRGGGHHDQPRGPGAAPPPGASRRPARCAPTSTSSPTSPSGSARRCAFATDPAAVFDELARRQRRRPRRLLRASAYARLDAEQACSGRARRRHPGRRGCSRARSPTPTGGPGSSPVAARRPGRRPARATRPIYLATGRVLAQYQSGAQTRRVAGAEPHGARVVRRAAPAAGRCGWASSRATTSGVTSTRGSARAPARITPTIRPDTVFMPFHWAGDAPPTRSPTTRLDPVSGMPEFKVCAVSVARAEDVLMEATGMREQVVVVGRGHGRAPLRRGAGAARPRPPVRRTPGGGGGVRALQPDPAHGGARAAFRRRGADAAASARAGHGAARRDRDVDRPRPAVGRARRRHRAAVRPPRPRHRCPRVRAADRGHGWKRGRRRATAPRARAAHHRRLPRRGGAHRQRPPRRRPRWRSPRAGGRVRAGAAWARRHGRPPGRPPDGRPARCRRGARCCARPSTTSASACTPRPRWPR